MNHSMVSVVFCITTFNAKQNKKRVSKYEYLTHVKGPRRVLMDLGILKYSRSLYLIFFSYDDQFLFIFLGLRNTPF